MRLPAGEGVSKHPDHGSAVLLSSLHSSPTSPPYLPPLPLVVVLGDPNVYAYTGGEPPSAGELRSRYARQVEGQSDDGAEGWLNWITRDRETQLAVGTVQATLRVTQDVMSAELAWIVGVAHQGHGYATEASSATVGWLRRHGVDAFAAHIRPGHEASEGVARRIGLRPTDAVRDGETRWVSATQ